MHRAARLAREITIQTDTSLVITENGQLVRIPAKLPREAAVKSNETSA
jgi:hypothetical protein